MEYDKDKVDELGLALLHLTMFDENEYGARAWIGHDWEAMDRTRGTVPVRPVPVRPDESMLQNLGIYSLYDSG